MELSTADVEHIARLARVRMTADEAETMRGQLADILHQFRSLSEVATDDVEATAHPSGASGKLRVDSLSSSQSQSHTLANAPHRQGDFIRVRAVLQ